MYILLTYVNIDHITYLFHQQVLAVALEEERSKHEEKLKEAIEV